MVVSCSLQPSNHLRKGYKNSQGTEMVLESSQRQVHYLRLTLVFVCHFLPSHKHSSSRFRKYFSTIDLLCYSPEMNVYLCRNYIWFIFDKFYYCYYYFCTTFLYILAIFSLVFNNSWHRWLMFTYLNLCFDCFTIFVYPTLLSNGSLFDYNCFYIFKNIFSYFCRWVWISEEPEQS